ncbi:MAG: DMT family transporter [Gammaproteobacteria bacterium]|nr:MAG: DMT family transporter [Gammaproteobacteria bacterium]
MTARPRHWLALLSLVVLWGSSYLMIEFALRAWRPAEIAGLRIAAGALVLLVAVRAGRHRLPGGWRHWAWFLGIAVIGNALPFYLISWGQQGVESGLAGILAASTPLFTLLLAHWLLDDERLEARQALAFVAGFSGVAVLLGLDSLAAVGGGGLRLWSQLAILAGAACYAVATVAARFMPPAHPVVTSAGVMLVAALLMSPAGYTAVQAIPATPWASLAAMLFLGVLGTGAASIMYFYLIAETGARFTAQLNYLVPVWAVLLGKLVLDEPLRWSSLLALALVLSGLYLMRHSAAPPRRRSG